LYDTIQGDMFKHNNFSHDRVPFLHKNLKSSHRTLLDGTRTSTEKRG
jgi:hypothetical protein